MPKVIVDSCVKCPAFDLNFSRCAIEGVYHHFDHVPYWCPLNRGALTLELHPDEVNEEYEEPE